MAMQATPTSARLLLTSSVVLASLVGCACPRYEAPPPRSAEAALSVPAHVSRGTSRALSSGALAGAGSVGLPRRMGKPARRQPDSWHGPLAAFPANPRFLAQEVETAAPAADGEGPQWPTVGVNLGAALLASFGTTLRLDSETLGRGTEVDFEDLGLDSSVQTFRADAYWNISRRHRIDLSWFRIDRSAGRTLTEDIQWGDHVLPAGSGIEARFKTNVIKLAYRFNVFAEPNWELGASLGMHGMGLRSSLTLKGNEAIGESFSVPAPLPVVGLHGTWAVLDRLKLRGSAELFYIKLSGVDIVDDIEGGLLDTLVGVEWDPLRHAGVGVAYNFFTMRAAVGKDRLELTADYEYHGLLLYLRLFL